LPDQIRKDRAEIADLYLQGKTQHEIGVQLGLSRQQIGYDLAAVRQEWLQSALMDFNARKAQELAKIDRLEQEYWAAWDASKKDRQVSTTEQTTGADGERLKAGIRKEEQTGEARYLTGVQWCIQKRCDILGLDDPKKVHLTSEGTCQVRIDVFQQVEQYAALFRARREQPGLLASPVPGDGAEQPLDQASTNGQTS
jgi:hypothetical protein